MAMRDPFQVAELVRLVASYLRPSELFAWMRADANIGAKLGEGWLRATAVPEAVWSRVAELWSPLVRDRLVKLVSQPNAPIGVSGSILLREIMRGDEPAQEPAPIYPLTPNMQQSERWEGRDLDLVAPPTI